MKQQITDEEIGDAGPITLRHMLTIECEQNKKLQQLLSFGRDAAKSAAGNLIAFDDRIKRLFDEVITVKK